MLGKACTTMCACVLLALSSCASSHGGREDAATRDTAPADLAGPADAPPGEALVSDGPRDAPAAEAATADGDHARDAAGDASGAEAEPSFPCGSSTCRGDQYCVAIVGGAAPPCYPRPDSGVCPPGTKEFCSSGQLPNGCEQIVSAGGGGGSCTDPTPGCPANDHCHCACGVIGDTCNISGRDVTCFAP